MSRAALLALAAGAAALLPAAASAAPPPKVVLTLVDPNTNLTQEPPLQQGAIRGETEGQIFRQRVDSRERVTVGVDSTGKPVTIEVDQRLRVIGKGDYLYSVAAPAISVSPTADSQSAPGLRRGAILWAGFSPGERLLGAHARLAPGRIRKLLPLKVSLRALVDGTPLRPGERRSGQLELRLVLQNATRTAAPSATAHGDAPVLAQALDAARRHEYPIGGVSISVGTPVDARTSQIEAPLAVRGTLTVPGGRTFRFSTLLGDGRPLTQQVVSFSGAARNVGAPQLRVVAEPVDPQRTLVPPRGRTWAEAVKLDPSLDSTALLSTAEDAYLRAARAHQYRTFLADPGTVPGTNTGDYLYVSAAPVAAPAPPEEPGGGLGTLGLAVTIAGGLLLAGGLAVAWAHF